VWTEILIISIVTLVLGVGGTLFWWRLADDMVDEEHRRFKRRPATGDTTDSTKVVVTSPERDA
jgi:hypothetical protein